MLERTSRRLVVYIVVAALLGALFVSATLYLRYSRAEVLLIRQSATNFLLPPLTYKGATYATLDDAFDAHTNVHGTRAIAGLAYIATLTRLSPIMGLEGTDPELLEQNIVLLEESAKILSTLYGTDEAATIKEKLYPHAYLAALPELERLRRSLITAPNVDVATAYHQKLLETIDAYAEGIDMVAKSISDASKNHEGAMFVYWGGQSSPKTFIERLNALHAQSLTMRAHAEERVRCLRHFDPDRCERPTLPSMRYTTDDVPISTELQTRLAETTDIIRRRIAAPIEGDSRAPFLIALQKSVCFPNEQPVVYYPWEATPPNRPSVYRYEMVNDLFFYDLKELSGLPVYEALRSRGLSFMHQPANMPYLCPNSGLVLATLHTIRYVRAELERHPLPKDAPAALTSEAYDALIESERTLLEAPVITEAMVARYLAAWATLVETYGERTLAEALTTQSVVARTSMLTAAAQQSPYFERSIAFIEYLNIWMTALGSEQPTQFMALVLSRTLPSIIFMPANPTVAATPVSFFRTHEDINFSIFKPRTRRYWDDLRDTVGADRLVAEMRNEIEIMEKRFDLEY